MDKKHSLFRTRRIVGLVALLLIVGLFVWGFSFPDSGYDYAGPVGTFWRISNFVGYLWLIVTVLSKGAMILDKRNLFAGPAAIIWSMMTLAGITVSLAFPLDIPPVLNQLQFTASVIYFFGLPLIDIFEIT